MRSRPLDWIKEFPEMDDVPSLLSMRKFAEAEANDANQLLDLIGRGNSDSVPFETELAEANEAISLINTRLQTIGVSL